MCNTYLANSEGDFELNCQATRLLYDILPGLEGGEIFQDSSQVIRLKIVKNDLMLKMRPENMIKTFHI